MEAVSIRQFAKLDGCNEKLVRRGIAEGRLKKLPSGKIDAALAGSTWRQGNISRQTVVPAPPPRSASPKQTNGRGRELKKIVKATAAAMDVTPTPAEPEPEEPWDPNDPKQLALGLAAHFDTKWDADKFNAAYAGALKKIDFDLKSGKVVLIGEVAAQMGEVLRAVKSRLLSIPATVAPMVAAMKNPAEVRAVLEREIHSVLEELASADIDSGEPGGTAQL